MCLVFRCGPGQAEEAVVQARARGLQQAPARVCIQYITSFVNNCRFSTIPQ